MSAANELAHQLARRHETHEWLPCQTGDPERFFEGTPTELQAVAQECAPCGLKALCAAAADELGERYGVWGGQVRDRAALQQINRLSKKAS